MRSPLPAADFRVAVELGRALALVFGHEDGRRFVLLFDEETPGLIKKGDTVVKDLESRPLLLWSVRASALVIPLGWTAGPDRGPPPPGAPETRTRRRFHGAAEGSHVIEPPETAATWALLGHGVRIDYESDKRARPLQGYQHALEPSDQCYLRGTLRAGTLVVRGPSLHVTARGIVG